jgi:hypothetical protein
VTSRTFRKREILQNAGEGMSIFGGALLLTGFAPGIGPLFPEYIPTLSLLLGILLVILGLAISQR